MPDAAHLDMVRLMVRNPAPMPRPVTLWLPYRLCACGNAPAGQVVELSPDGSESAPLPMCWECYAKRCEMLDFVAGM